MSDRAGSSDIYVMDADGSNLVRRTQTGLSEAPAWSPDGSKIAFSSLRDGQFAIYAMSEAAGFARPAWSSDGSTIAFSSRSCRHCAGSLRYVSTDGTKSGLIFSNGHSPAWRP